MEKTDKRTKYLNKAADIICRTAYRLCKVSLLNRNAEDLDAKVLKDVCSAVKEAISIWASLDKTVGGESIKVIMEPEAERMAR